RPGDARPCPRAPRARGGRARLGLPRGRAAVCARSPPQRLLARVRPERGGTGERGRLALPLPRPRRSGGLRAADRRGRRRPLGRPPPPRRGPLRRLVRLRAYFPRRADGVELRAAGALSTDG